MAAVSCLLNNILQNIFFCVQQKKCIHTGLETLLSEQMMTAFSFLDELAL